MPQVASHVADAKQTGTMPVRFADEIGPNEPLADRALVTMAVGDRYLCCWQQVARPTWTAYADRHGIDIVVIRAPVDASARAAARSVAWQKCLVPAQPWAMRYRRLCWVDADILINPDSPDIFNDVPDGQIGATSVHDQLSRSEKHVLLERVHRRRFSEADIDPVWAETQVGLYRAAAIDTQRVDMIQTGVVVFDPERHAGVFAASYAYDRDTIAYEQPSLSHEIWESGRFHRISARWNWGLFDAVALHYPMYLGDDGRMTGPANEFAVIAGRELHSAYFLHFYRMFGILEMLRPSVSQTT